MAINKRVPNAEAAPSASSREMADSPFLLFGFFALVVIGIIAWTLYRAHERQKALAALAQRLGMTFDKHRHRLDPTLADLEATSLGTSRSMLNELRGSYKDREVRCFDYWCKVQQGKNKAVRTRGVILVRVPMSWPQLRIVPEHIGHKLADALGADDIDFESQDFSDRFWVRSPDHRFAYDVIHPRMMEYLMEPGLTRWEARDGWLCLWSDSVLDADEIVAALDRATGFVQRVPAHVWGGATA